ncbi:MAG: SIR2 family protein [Chloroflexi bacterium]|nr:SIR2 family protein [Chloroflexota bacterium]
MVQEPALRIALGLHSNPGAYALLLGSGVSTSAGVPTGWSIVLDLIRKLAAAAKENAVDPAAWYRQTFGEEPDYSAVLSRLAKTQADRMSLLRRYFEPTEEDRAAGFKLPTKAHRAIARLVALGYIRVILTTNFDRLMETALQEEGIVPTVIASPDAARGALPYSLEKCVLVKLNGDYLDTRIKNTAEELASHEPDLQRFIDRVLDDLGLIVCGWSGDWDIGLREAILATPNRRFAMYWLARSQPNTEAQRIITHRRAEVVHITGAEDFFSDLLEKVEALRELERPDPLTVSVGVTMAKRYLAESQYRIRLHDLIHGETERSRQAVLSESFNTGRPQPDREAVAKRLKGYDAALERLLPILAVVGYHGGDETAGHLTRTVQRLAPEGPAGGSHFDAWERLRFYPALACIYASGLVALTQRKFRYLAALFLRTFYFDGSRTKQPLLLYANHARVFAVGKGLLPEPYDRNKYPGSDYLADRIRSVLNDYLPSEREYLEAFDQFEYLLALVLWNEVGSQRNWAPLGSFVWRRWSLGSADTLLSDFLAELEKSPDLGAAGFFNASSDALRSTAATLVQRLQPIIQELLW